jgi:hypothetical protein
MKNSLLSPFNSAIGKAAIVALSLFLAAAAPRASAVTFNLEDQTATSSGATSPGAYTTLALNNSGLMMTLSRQGGSTFDIVDATSATFPSSFATRALDPFSDTSASGFVANFSASLSGFSLEFGDFDGDRDKLTLSAYSGLNGTGTLLGTVTVNWNGDFGAGDPAAIASLSGLSGIQSVVFIGGSSRFFPNSVYYDNFTATLDMTTVPEGGSSLVLLGFGFVGLAFAGRIISRRHTVPA